MKTYKIGEQVARAVEDIKNGKDVYGFAEWILISSNENFDLFLCSHCGISWVQYKNVNGHLEELHRCPDCGCYMTM